MTTKPPYIVYEITHHGGRQVNEDYFFHLINPDWSLFMVADGLGGHPKGEEASKAFSEAVKHTASSYYKRITKEPLLGIGELVFEAQLVMRKTIVDAFGEVDARTTFALAWLSKHNMVTAHIGDSRIYRINNQGVLWRSSDHTVVQEMMEKGLITEEEMALHPLQNHLLNSVTIDEPPQADLTLHPPLEADECIVLCTDGFWELMNARELVHIVNSDNISTQIDSVIHNALEQHPWADNITVQVVKPDF